MDNWDKFQENLQTAYTSTGSLQEQADIYAESWEAAQARVQAAAESIYADLIDDKFFITLTNGLAGVLDAVSGLTDGFGGLGGVLAFVGSIFTKVYADRMPSVLHNLSQNIKVLTGQASKEMIEIQEITAKNLEKGAIKAEGRGDTITAQEYKGE
jgi:hypothetical protein